MIQYAWDGDGHTCEPSNGHFADLSNWQSVLSYFGYSQPQSGWVEFAFPSKQARCLRVLGTELSQDDYGYRYLQLSEIELYGGSVSATATQDTIAADD